MHLNRRLVAPVAATLLIAACTPPGMNGSGNEQRISLGGLNQVQPAAPVQAPLGLVNAPFAVGADQIAVLGSDGAPLAGAHVTIGQTSLTTNEKGLVKLPAGVEAGKVEAIVEADGRVPRAVMIAAGFGVVLDQLDPAQTPVKVASGAVVKNATDTMRVNFAPGALVADGDVRVTRLYVDNAVGLKNLPPHVRATVEQTFQGRDPIGGYTYHLDVPGGRLAPGADVTVDFKVEPRMAAYLTEMSQIPDWLEKGDLKDTFRKDAQGNWWFSMKVPTPPPAPAGEAGVANGFSLKAAACNNYNDIETYYVPDQRLASRNATRTVEAERVVGYWAQEWYARPVQHCDPVPGGVAVHDPAINGGHCYYTSSCPDVWESYSVWRTYVERYSFQENYTEWYWESFMRAEQRPWTSKSINARVTYASDDARFAGKALANILVNFSHAGTPVRGPILQGYTGGDGIATGEGQAGIPGRASAAASEAYTFGTSASYNVDCGTVDLNIVKNRPIVNLTGKTNGAVVGSTISQGTPLGAVSLTPGGTTQWKPGIDGSDYSLSFGGNQKVGDGWVDVDGPAGAKIHWNGTHNLTADMWYSRTIGASARWTSNDASVPADQQPATKWNGQAVAKAAFTFNHPLSAAKNKPSGRDVMSFNDVASASTWGLSGASGTVTAVPTPGEATLQGTGNTQITGGTTVVDVNADLPQVKLRFPGGTQGTYTLTYKLTRSDGQSAEKKMEVTVNGDSVVISLPVEEPVGKIYKHSFQIVSMLRGAADDVVSLTDNSFAFPVVGGLYRGTRAPADYAELKTKFVSAK